MHYSKEDINNLIQYLKEKLDFKVLTDFFEDYYIRGYFEFGFSIPGNQSSAFIVNELQNYFPDVLYALFIEKKYLPLFINKLPNQCHENVIARWRLGIDK